MPAKSMFLKTIKQYMYIIQKSTTGQLSGKCLPPTPVVTCLITKFFSSEVIVLLGSYVSFQDRIFLFNTVTDIWIFSPSSKFLNIRIIKCRLSTFFSNFIFLPFSFSGLPRKRTKEKSF